MNISMNISMNIRIYDEIKLIITLFLTTLTCKIIIGSGSAIKGVCLILGKTGYLSYMICNEHRGSRFCTSCRTNGSCKRYREVLRSIKVLLYLDLTYPL